MAKKTGTSKAHHYFNVFTTFVEKKYWIILIILSFIGLYLRFHDAVNVMEFAFDQSRDLWAVRDILRGTFLLEGPKTGTGSLHLGPLYYYWLAPFLAATRMEPEALIISSAVINLGTFLLLFFITRKIFNVWAAFFVLLLYAVNHYLIIITRSPWNVSFMPAVGLLIFYGIYQIYQGKLKWVFVVWAFAGLFFHIHFTAVFMPFIIVASLIFVKDKKKVLLYSLYSIPLYLIWFVPSTIALLQKNGSGQYVSFLDYYVIKPTIVTFMPRVTASLSLFDLLLYLPHAFIFRFIIPAIFVVVTIFEKSRKQKILNYIILVWVVVPLGIFMVYGGQITDYYFLFAVGPTLYIFWILISKFYALNPKICVIPIMLFLAYYTYHNTQGLWLRQEREKMSLSAMKEDFKNAIRDGRDYPYLEGHLSSYLYTVWVLDKKEK